MKTLNPKTIEEAVDSLQQFLKCDLYTKFRPKEIFNDKEYKRTDPFEDKIDFLEYMNTHFDLLKKQIKELTQSD